MVIVIADEQWGSSQYFYTRKHLGEKNGDVFKNRTDTTQRRAPTRSILSQSFVRAPGEVNQFWLCCGKRLPKFEFGLHLCGTNSTINTGCQPL